MLRKTPAHLLHVPFGGRNVCIARRSAHPFGNRLHKRFRSHDRHLARMAVLSERPYIQDCQNDSNPVFDTHTLSSSLSPAPVDVRRQGLHYREPGRPPATVPFTVPRDGRRRPVVRSCRHGECVYAPGRL